MQSALTLLALTVFTLSINAHSASPQPNETISLRPITLTISKLEATEAMMFNASTETTCLSIVENADLSDSISDDLNDACMDRLYAGDL